MSFFVKSENMGINFSNEVSSKKEDKKRKNKKKQNDPQDDPHSTKTNHFGIPFRDYSC